MRGASDAVAGCGRGGTPESLHNHKRPSRKSLQRNETTQWQNNANRAGVTATWRQYSTWPVRDRALAVAATFQLSWSATIGQLRNLDVIGWDDHRVLSEQEPRSGDYRRLELSWNEELSPPYLSPGFAAAVLNAYATGTMTAARSLELLRGTLVEDDLPQLEPLSLDDLRRSFAGHDG